MELPKRLMSLDVFRGLTILLMIIVNNPGSWEYVYPPLRHSQWNGCTPTDLVFPFFLFIMGVAMWFSFKKFNHRITSKVVMKILRRTVIIFLIGLAINVFSVNHIDFGQLRIMSVLQRIALGYCAASFIILGFREFYVIIVTAVILLGYWAILLIFGGDNPFSLEGNFIRVFDAFILGENHIPVYAGVKFDMTGLLSTLPSIANILLGYFSGRIIDLEKDKINVVKKLFLYGVAGVLAGLAWGLVFPINKLLWSSSYVVYTSGLAMLFLAVFYWVIDIKGYKKWSFPALVYGMNPLFIYVLAAFWVRILMRIDIPVSSGESLPVTSWIYLKIMVPFAGNMVGSLLYALHLGVIFFFIAWWLYHKKIFIKL